MMQSRQVIRAEERALKKLLRGEAAHKKRRVVERDLKHRQMSREVSGFYAGRVSVALALASRRAGRLYRRVLIDDTGNANRGNLRRLG